MMAFDINLTGERCRLPIEVDCAVRTPDYLQTRCPECGACMSLPRESPQHIKPGPGLLEEIAVVNDRNVEQTVFY